MFFTGFPLFPACAFSASPFWWLTGACNTFKVMFNWGHIGNPAIVVASGFFGDMYEYTETCGDTGSSGLRV